MHCYISATCKKDKKTRVFYTRMIPRKWSWVTLTLNWIQLKSLARQCPWLVRAKRSESWILTTFSTSFPNPSVQLEHTCASASSSSNIHLLYAGRTIQKVWAKHLIVSSMGFFPAQPLHFLLIECGDICYIVMGDQDKDSQIWIREGKWHRRLGEIK